MYFPTYQTNNPTIQADSNGSNENNKDQNPEQVQYVTKNQNSNQQQNQRNLLYCSAPPKTEFNYQPSPNNYNIRDRNYNPNTTNQNNLIQDGKSPKNFGYQKNTSKPSETSENQRNARNSEFEKWKKMYNSQSNNTYFYHIIYGMIQELGLKARKDDRNDFDQLTKILCTLRYPSSYLADLHQKANNLGEFDIVETQNLRKKVKQSGVKFCQCCQLPQQKNELSLLTDLEKIQRLGLSTYLFFNTIKSMIALFFVLLIVFAVYSIVTNVGASFKYQEFYNGWEIQNKYNSFYGLLSTSIGSKYYLKNQISQTQITIQCWLGLLCVIIWGGLFLVIKIQELRKEAQLKKQQISISNYTLKFSNLSRNKTKQILQYELIEYQKRIKAAHPQLLQELNSIPIAVEQLIQVGSFDLEKQIENESEFQEKKERLQAMKQQLKKLIIDRQNNNEFTLGKIQRQTIIDNVETARVQFHNYIGQYLKKQYEAKSAQLKRSQYSQYLVVFAHTQNKELIERLHDNQESLIMNLPFFKQNQYYLQNIGAPLIEPASEPEDIIWKNLGRSQFERNLLSFTTILIGVVLLCLSFLITFILTHLQISYSHNYQIQGKTAISFLLSIIISITLVLVNFVISVIFKFLTEKEFNPAKSFDHISIGKKTIAATLVNIIVVPIAVNFISKANLFGVDGLADEVLSLALSNSIVGPILIWINISYCLKRIQFFMKNTPNSKLSLNQNTLNALNEPVQFQIGQSYANIVTLFLFTCFFASLQPLIVPVGMIGLLLTYLAEKYNLLRKQKKPNPCKSQIHESLSSFIYLGPLFYSLGSFIWTDVVSLTFIDAFPNIVAIIVSFIIFFIPYEFFGKKLTEKEKPYRVADYMMEKAEFIKNNYKRKNPLSHQFYAQTNKNIANNNQNYRSEQNQTPEMRQQVYFNNASDKVRLDEFFYETEDKSIQITSLNKYFIKIYESNLRQQKQKENQKMNATNYSEFYKDNQIRQSNRGGYWFQKQQGQSS